MKNKKLFAILTLLCFMFTLMPVAAFAAETAAVENPNKVASSMSAVWTADTDIDRTETAAFNLSIRNVEGQYTTSDVYVWVTKQGSNVPLNTVKVAKTAEAVATTAAGEYVYPVTNAKTGEKQFYVGFNSTGVFTVHVSAIAPQIESGKIAGADEFNAAGTDVTVTTKNATVENMGLQVSLPVDDNYYVTDVTGNYNKLALVNNQYLTDGETATALDIVANNVDEKEVVVTFAENKGTAEQPYWNPLAGKTLTVETAGAIEVSKETVTTNVLGQAKFTVSGNAEGTYKIYVSYGQFEVVIEVEVNATSANTIECTEEPANPIDILNADLTNGLLGDYVEFTMYDVNGNELDTKNKAGWENAAASGTGSATYNAEKKGYVTVVSQPTSSKLENKDLWFDGVSIRSAKAITVEGEYTFKVVLNNGNYATATIVVKEFTKPVKLVVEYPEAIELGTTVGFSDLYWLDANNVEKKAYSTVNGKTNGVKVSLAANGYAIADFDATTGKLSAKTDEKYVGAEISITAVDERYNLIATDVVTVADDAKELKFADKTAEVKVNNKIRVNVVDSQGKNVVLNSAKTAEYQNAKVAINYVILDKPADARVFVSTAKDKLLSDGYFEMNLTSNVVGNVTVQAVVKYSYQDTETQANVVKYYTGTQIFAVGTAGVGDVVVMSVGSNEIIINDAKATIDAAPIVENNRTFVPFRALAEAFGATVAYDEATQAVTAELNGTTVVMTIGSATYTVNGVEKTADVAPFINGSRTMVPVRFAAEAFGIKVIPTYDENGATADILFNL